MRISELEFRRVLFRSKKAPNIRNMMMLALAVAASALLPRNCPTQIELTEPDNVWRMFDASVGSAKRIKVLVIGPCVRSDRKSVVSVKSVSVRVDLGGRRILKKKNAS